MAKRYDPFNDRTSRDIRNTLSTALVGQLTGSDPRAVEKVAMQWLAKVEDAAYSAYIHYCQNAYAKVSREVESTGLTDARSQAVVLWNAELFFEMHELLETIWHGSVGHERKALKGLIQAAGAYVHRQHNNRKASFGLARRARQNLRWAQPHLDFIANLDQLLGCLKDPAAPPPKLVLQSEAL